MITLYGLDACDTCRKARKELENAGFAVTFHDVRKDPLSSQLLSQFFEQFGEALVNRRSTTWRGLSDAQRAGDPIALLAEHPTLMKRPVIQNGDTRTLGWDATARTAHLG